MKRLKLISDQTTTQDGQVVVYSRRIITYDSETNKSPEQKYREANMKQFYGWINPNMGETE
jgi:hypothetical protein